MISGLVLTLGAAYALFVFVERPIAGLRRRFRTKEAHAWDHKRTTALPKQETVSG